MTDAQIIQTLRGYARSGKNQPRYDALMLAARRMESMLAEHDRLRAELEAAGNAMSALESDKVNLEMNLEHTDSELEAAKRDIKSMLQGENHEELCVFCKSIRHEMCFVGNCLNAEWRGPVAENAPAPEMGAAGDEAMGAGDGEKEG